MQYPQSRVGTRRRDRPSMESMPQPVSLELSRAGEVVTITQLPATVNLFLYQGDSFAFTITVKEAGDQPFDLDGWDVRSQIRATTESADVAGEFAPTVEANVITMTLTPAVSALVPRTAVWDVEIHNEALDELTTLAAGTISMAPQVTRLP